MDIGVLSKLIDVCLGQCNAFNIDTKTYFHKR